jgi:hypothetical protein
MGYEVVLLDKAKDFLDTINSGKRNDHDIISEDRNDESK